MPVEFLSQERRERLGRFSADPTAEQLARYFHLDDVDRALVDRRARDRARLGFALQLGTVRFLGTFLAEPTDVPRVVVEYVARQLGIADVSVLKGYGDGERRWDHAAEIRRAYGYQDFGDEAVQRRLREWLEARAWTMGERRGVLFDLAIAWLLEHKVLLPGPTVLERFVASVHEQATVRLWSTLASAPAPSARRALEQLLVVAPGARRSGFDRLRQGPTAPSAAGITAALRRLEEVRALGLSGVDLAGVPQGRLDALARFTAKARAQALDRMGPERRLAHLVAFAATLETTALDEVLDTFDLVVGELLGRAARKAQRERLRTLGDLDAAALVLRDTYVRLRRAAADPNADLRRFLLDTLSEPELDAALETVTTVVESSEGDRQAILLARCGTIRRFLPMLLKDVDFGGNEAGQAVLDALGFLRRQDVERPRPSWDDAPIGVVAGSRLQILQADPAHVDHRAYMLCAVERVREALRRRDVFVPGSRRWADPRRQLLSGADWEAARDDVCRSLRRSPDARIELGGLADKLEAAYRRSAAGLADNAAVTIVERDGKARLKRSPLDRLDEPGSVVDLSQAVGALLPKVDLPEVVLEVARWTGFAEEFTHVSEAGSRAEDLVTSICAVLVAEACNVGLEPMARQDVPALRRGLLGWVAQNYLRAETLARANAGLVAYHAERPLARMSWRRLSTSSTAPVTRSTRRTCSACRRSSSAT